MSRTHIDRYGDSLRARPFHVGHSSRQPVRTTRDEADVVPALGEQSGTRPPDPSTGSGDRYNRHAKPVPNRLALTPEDMSWRRCAADWLARTV